MANATAHTKAVRDGVTLRLTHEEARHLRGLVSDQVSDSKPHEAIRKALNAAGYDINDAAHYRFRGGVLAPV